MIISKSPLRISLFGGGSDLRAFYEKHGGRVLSFSIDRYVYVAVNTKFESGFRVSYSKTENVATIADIEHPIVKNALSMFRTKDSLEIVSVADIPSTGSGLGSSSAFTAALVKGLSHHQGIELNKHEIAQRVCEIEIEMTNQILGKQDQYAVTFGGINNIHFLENGEVEVSPLSISHDKVKDLEDSLLLFYTGVSRQAAPLLAEQSKLTTEDSGLVENLKVMKSFCDEGEHYLKEGKLVELGELLHLNWGKKKTLNSGVTSASIEKTYETTRANGAIGGKLLGAGGGGFFLILADPKDHSRIVESIPEWKHQGFKLDHEGVKSYEI
jgi:D-glycero-alpha-D-manno-heptose-7-phosphate kinase